MSLETTKTRIQNEVFLKTEKNSLSPSSLGSILEEIADLTISSSSFPAPHLETLVPDSTLPSTNLNIVLNGSYFTENMTVDIVGQTVNYIDFQSSNVVMVNILSSDVEGDYDVILNNGSSRVFKSFFLVVLGEVIKPIDSQWINKSLLDTDADALSVQTYNVMGTAEWNQPLDFLIDWSLRFNCKYTPLGAFPENLFSYGVYLLDSADVQKVRLGLIRNKLSQDINISSYLMGETRSIHSTILQDLNETSTIEFRYSSTTNLIHIYYDGFLIDATSLVITENLRLKVDLSLYNIENIKYIKLQ